jgi:hypothetical protein
MTANKKRGHREFRGPAPADMSVAFGLRLLTETSEAAEHSRCLEDLKAVRVGPTLAVLAVGLHARMLAKSPASF